MKSFIAWFAKNPVAANFLMVIIIVGGLVTILNIKQEIFPETEWDIITITVPYLGATPEEVEEGVCVRVEEALEGLSDIEKITSRASEGIGTVSVEVVSGGDADRLLEDIKSRVDAISTFPAETEKPIVRQIIARSTVISVAVAGDADEKALKALGERVREDILGLDDVSQADLSGVRGYEITIEVTESDLRRYKLTFDAVVNAVRRSSLDLPAGSIKAEGGEILLRTKGQAYTGRDFESIVVIAAPDGTRVTIGDIARVKDAFADTDQYSRFNGKPCALIEVYRVGEENAITVADAVKEYVERANEQMPEGVELTTWLDRSRLLKDRRNLLVKNGAYGFILVLLLLSLFLRPRLAFWVSMGIPISFMGAFWLMPFFDISINMISLFSFILILGIVVDDAIIVGESIFKRQETEKDGVKAAIEGCHKVAIPVIFAVLTTIVAFFPLLFISGPIGRIWRVIPIIVIATLVFSLVESMMILPAHLSHRGAGEKKTGLGWFIWPWQLLEMIFMPVTRQVSKLLRLFIDRVYTRILGFCADWRYLTLAVGIACLLLTYGYWESGRINIIFMPKVESDFITANLTLPQGTPIEVTAAALQRMEDAAFEVKDELDTKLGFKDKSVINNMLVDVGAASVGMGVMHSVAGTSSNSNAGTIRLELCPSEDRSISASEIARAWRKIIGVIPDVVELSLKSSAGPSGGGAAVDFQLTGSDNDELVAAAAELREKLYNYEGLVDITDTFRGGKREIKLNIKPSAEPTGLALSDLARQVRYAFYGAEAQRIQRGRDDVRVMVRYPRDERRSLGALERMKIRLPDGAEVPFGEVAEVASGRGFSAITRVDRNRVVDVTADIEGRKANAMKIMADVRENILPEIRKRHPGVSFIVAGEQSHMRDAMGELVWGFVLACLVIFALMAVPFKSYIQPVIIMLSIPFSLMGAVVGHIIFGLDISILSMCGMVALAGIVVNDSIVLVYYINGRRREGVPFKEAVLEGGPARFRAIMLTSITTFAGLTPMLLERNMQAAFLIPMAVSLAFGVLFATFITLLLVPAVYLILEDVKALPGILFGWIGE